MSAIVFSVEWFMGGVPDPGLRKLRIGLERAGAEVLKLGKHVFPKVVPALEAAIGAQMQGGGIGSAGPFAPLSPRYAEWKAKHFPGAPILQRTRAMLGGLTDSGAPEAKRSITDEQLAFGTQGVPYASFHQGGTRTMPARQPIDLGADFEAALLQAARAGVREAVKEGSAGVLEFEGGTFDDNGVSRTILTGSRGGRFFINGAGGRTYLKRTADGRTVRREFGGAR